ncbi:hypothetical protein EVG20_g8245 [Dentipellis fragilis]|uniref:F-box domain-containing protein n=1 Tax=Dentipellis fragilis TaxID=205917 RepID=A0A4Y9Y8S5_9AGAM|nr:hypothetical protein EVG20_g8245 [Dentipellis fragilis]
MPGPSLAWAHTFLPMPTPSRPCLLAHALSRSCPRACARPSSPRAPRARALLCPCPLVPAPSRAHALSRLLPLTPAPSRARTSSPRAPTASPHVPTTSRPPFLSRASSRTAVALSLPPLLAHLPPRVPVVLRAHGLSHVLYPLVLTLSCPHLNMYNAVAHVNRLPSEALAHIFGFLLEIDKPYKWVSTTPDHHIGWLRVTQVCRQWRSAALNHPTLWSDIHFNLGLHWAEEFLRHSRMAPISFVYPTVDTTYGKADIDVVDVITRHMCHMQELDITVSEEKSEDMASIISALRRPAPLLEEAYIYNTGLLAPTLPEDIFAHATPRLRYLNIWSFNVAWSSLDFSSLIQLHVGAHSPDFGPQGLGYFLAALSRMPALEVLELHYAVSSLLCSSSPTSYTDPVACPKLRRFILKDVIIARAVALKHVVINSTTMVDIECIPDITGNEHGSDHILPWLTSYISVQHTTPHLKITCQPNGFKISIPGGLVASIQQPAKGLPGPEVGKYSFRVCIKYLARNEVFTELRAICRALPGLKYLEALSITTRCAFWSTQNWFSIFGGCHNLRRLELRLPVEDGDSLWTALGSSSHSLNNENPGPLFPLLMFLTLRGDNSGQNYNNIDIKLLQWMKLHKSLAPLQTVQFLRCHVDSAIICGLRAEVPEVIWDGKEIDGQS